VASMVAASGADRVSVIPLPQSPGIRRAAGTYDRELMVSKCQNRRAPYA
jgi:hypothetical protein